MGMNPNTSTALPKDIIKDPKSYGFESYSESRSIFLNPDSQFAGVLNPENYSAYPIATKRPDGALLGSPKVVGTRDVWALTDIYRYTNVDGRFNNPVGFYIVLWEDGQIDTVPYDLVISIPNGQSLRRPFFPGQAGVSTDGLSYDESFIRLPAGQIIPRGKPIEGGLDSPITDNGGPEAVVAFSRRLDFPDRYGIDRTRLWEIFSPSQAEFTLSDTQLGLKQLGLEAQLRNQSLSQLQRSGTPALLFLQDDGRIVTLTAIDDDRAVVIDRGVTQNVERSVLENRYSGEALVPTKALTQNAAIVADDAVREVKLPSLDAEVPQQFVLRNTGATPITLQLEYPLLGVTESKLSKDVIAPGETATLDLKVKWRSILEAPYQNILVSIQTNDPIVPRLQLAILLTPPQGAGN